MNSIRDRKAAIKKLKTLVYSTKQELEDFRKINEYIEKHFCL